jgi:hypothetical protein
VRIQTSGLVASYPGPDNDDAPLHPTRERPAFLPRLSYGQQALVALLSTQGARATVAPLYYAQANPELALVPAQRRLGLVLDPATHVRERPLATRAPVFRTHPWGAVSEAFDPDHTAISEAELLELATGPLDLQRGRGATLMLTSYHVAGPVGSRGRDLDLLLARAGIAQFRSERMDEHPEHAAVQVTREVYATLAVRVENLRDASVRRRLADAYLDLDADGLWVKLLGFHEGAHAIDVGAGAAFLRCLAEGPKPVISDGAGQLYLGLLACGISASIGIGDSERFRYPTDWKQATRNTKGQGRVRSAYHPSFLRSFKVSSAAAKAAFGISRCRCGHHPGDQPPTNSQVGAHAAIVRMSDARDALDGSGEERREWLRGLARKASWAEHDAELPARNALATFNRLFSGWDEPPADDQIAGAAPFN